MLQPALIIDLDGTLAIIGDRDPYDADLCGLDTVNPMVRQTMVWARADGWANLLVSGRGFRETHRRATERWLTWNELDYDLLLMREVGDTTPDDDLKERLYRTYIEGVYDTRLALDDRRRTTVRWRTLGVPCWRVDDRLD